MEDISHWSLWRISLKMKKNAWHLFWPGTFHFLSLSTTRTFSSTASTHSVRHPSLGSSKEALHPMCRTTTKRSHWPSTKGWILIDSRVRKISITTSLIASETAFPQRWNVWMYMKPDFKINFYTKVGCRLPWDKWSQQDQNVCTNSQQFRLSFLFIFCLMNSGSGVPPGFEQIIVSESMSSCIQFCWMQTCLRSQEWLVARSRAVTRSTTLSTPTSKICPTTPFQRIKLFSAFGQCRRTPWLKKRFLSTPLNHLLLSLADLLASSLDSLSWPFGTG